MSIDFVYNTDFKLSNKEQVSDWVLRVINSKGYKLGNLVYAFFNDEDLISGFLFNEKIIDNISDIEKIEKIGDPVGDFNIQNTIQATIKNSKNIEIDKLKRNFLTNSSCGVCGKTSLDTVEIVKNEKLKLDYPKIKKIGRAHV